ncbi:MAG: FAD:protein FMN transferase [Spirochaetes bacterium]|nr:FAD:protein FMN transferase [Spirochaetota bacterium]
MQSKTRVSPSFIPLFFPLLAIALFSITFGGILLSCSRPTEPISRVEFLLGTTCGVTVYGVKDTKALDAVFQRVREIENRMSVNIETSEVSEINRNAGIKPVRVSEETFHVISEGLRFSALSKGAFDIAIGRLVSLWGIGTDHARLPTPREIQEALAFIDYRSVELNAGNRTVFIKQKGIALDLGAIAKGWAADEAARVLREQGIQHAIIDFGGNILVMGSHPEGRPWRIGIQNPETSRGSYLAIVPGADLSVVTSGTYERFFIGPDGVKYHHLLDTKTGYPIRNGLDSVTVMAKKSIQADGLSTTLFALGWEEGLKLAESLEEVEAIFVTEDRKIYLTSGIRKTFELKNAEFQVMP